VQAHHIVWWERGGATDLDNLLLVCSFHHRLIHEHGWSIRGRATEERWLRPDGSAFEAGPGPPKETVEA
jgi:HNH endonuclease